VVLCFCCGSGCEREEAAEELVGIGGSMAVKKDAKACGEHTTAESSGVMDACGNRWGDAGDS